MVLILRWIYDDSGELIDLWYLQFVSLLMLLFFGKYLIACYDSRTGQKQEER